MPTIKPDDTRDESSQDHQGFAGRSGGPNRRGSARHAAPGGYRHSCAAGATPGTPTSAVSSTSDASATPHPLEDEMPTINLITPETVAAHMESPALRELDERTGDGVTVRLLWDPTADLALVEV